MFKQDHHFIYTNLPSVWALQDATCLTAPLTRVNRELKHTTLFEPRTTDGSQLFSCLTCLHLVYYIFIVKYLSFAETISLKIWGRSLSWHVKCLLPVSVPGFKSIACLSSLVVDEGGNRTTKRKPSKSDRDQLEPSPQTVISDDFIRWERWQECS